MDFDALVAVCITLVSSWSAERECLCPQDWDKYLNIRGALIPAFSLNYLIYSQTSTPRR